MTWPRGHALASAMAVPSHDQHCAGCLVGAMLGGDGSAKAQPPPASNGDAAEAEACH
jgi:hypothetical protein